MISGIITLPGNDVASPPAHVARVDEPLEEASKVDRVGRAVVSWDSFEGNKKTIILHWYLSYVLTIINHGVELKRQISGYIQIGIQASQILCPGNFPRIFPVTFPGKGFQVGIQASTKIHSWNKQQQRSVF